MDPAITVEPGGEEILQHAERLIQYEERNAAVTVDPAITVEPGGEEILQHAGMMIQY